MSRRIAGNCLMTRPYLLYTSDLPTSGNTTTATFADDTAILATHEEPAIASMTHQATINKINDWTKKWRIKINQSKSTYITFTLRYQTCPRVQMGNVVLTPHPKKVKCLSIHLDRRLSWAKHIKTKRNHHWLLGRSALSIESKLLLN
jgi:hypothetical protein